MNKKHRKIIEQCPVALTVSLIGNKWKLLIMRNLMMRPWRFNELQKSIGIISQKVLVDNLRAMESDGLVIRTIFPAVPPHVEYSLSELGQSMRPILTAMEKWGTEYQKKFHHMLNIHCLNWVNQCAQY